MAMGPHGVERFVTPAGAGVRTDDGTVSLGRTVMGGLLNLLSRAVLEDAKSRVVGVREPSLR
jgi:hypothetical protein